MSSFCFFSSKLLISEIWYSVVGSGMSDNAIAIRKSKLRAKLREQTNEFALELKLVLEDNLSNLGKELKKYSDEFLGFTI